MVKRKVQIGLKLFSLTANSIKGNLGVRMQNVIDLEKEKYDRERTKAVWDNMLGQSDKFNFHNLFLDEEAA